MSAELPIALDLSQAQKAAIDEVNRWRGHCIESFARLERGMTLTLEALPERQRGKFAYVFGDKLRRLTAIMSEAEPRTRAHNRICKSLAEASDLLSKRNLIVHSTATVSIAENQQWSWCYTFQPSAAGASDQTGSIAQAEGKHMEVALAKQVQRLCGQLRSFREAMKKEEAVTE